MLCLLSMVLFMRFNVRWFCPSVHSVDFARQEFDALSAFSLRHVMWQRVIRGAGRFKVRDLIGHRLHFI